MQSKEKFAKCEIDMGADLPEDGKYDVRGFRLVPRSEPKNVTFERVAKEHQACLIFLSETHSKRTILDAFTASACKTVYDAANDEVKAKLIALPWSAMIGIVWKCVK